MTTRIVLDARLPSELDDAATSATTADWVTIQKAGESILRRINPLDAVPPLPASRIDTGTFDPARIPALSIDTDDIVGGAISAWDAAYTAGESTITGSFSDFQTISITTPSAGILLIAVSARMSHAWAGSVTTTSFIEWQLRRGTTALWTQDATGMLAPGAAGVLAVGGTVSGVHIQSVAAGLTSTFTLRARNYISSGSGTLTSKISERRIEFLYLKR